MNTAEKALPAKEVKVDFKQFNKLSSQMRKYMITTLAQSFNVKEEQLVAGGVNLVQHSNALDATAKDKTKTNVGNQTFFSKTNTTANRSFENGGF